MLIWLNRGPGDPLECFNGDQLFMADRRHHKEAICAKQKKGTEQIFRNLAKGVKSPFLSLFSSPVGPLGPRSKKEKRTFLVFTLRTIPENLKEILPTVSQIQLLTD